MSPEQIRGLELDVQRSAAFGVIFYDARGQHPWLTNPASIRYMRFCTTTHPIDSPWGEVV
jgi:hypothetical protein